MTITKDILYVGVDDHQVDLFEGQYDVPLGMAYNSYVIMDEKIAVMDSVEGPFADEWLEKIDAAIAGFDGAGAGSAVGADGGASSAGADAGNVRTPDYLIVQHMEPDHSSSITNFMEKYPKAQIVSSKQAFGMMKNFYGTDYADEMVEVGGCGSGGTMVSRQIVVGEGSTLSLGAHTLTFVTTPMVHWPEVIMTYDAKDKVLFSADGFGKFGANDVEDPEGWACEARRYYFGIVGKYGAQVQAVLKKAAGLEIEHICSLHGPVLNDNLDYYLGIYDTWSSYKPEEPGIFIAYTSVYGNTKKAALLLADKLRKKGAPKVAIADLAREDFYESVEDAFRYDRLVLATTTYNNGVFPKMDDFIHALLERGYQNRKIAFIENGSWAPVAGKLIQKYFEESKDIEFAENNVTIKSALNEESEAAICRLAEELA